MGFWDAHDQAYAATKGALDSARVQRANSAIAGALQTGDYSGAAQAAFGAGNPQVGALLMKTAQEQKDRQQDLAFNRAFAGGALSPLAKPGGALSAPPVMAPPTQGALAAPPPATPVSAPIATPTDAANTVDAVTVVAKKKGDTSALDAALTAPADPTPLHTREQLQAAFQLAHTPEQQKMIMDEYAKLPDPAKEAFAKRSVLIANGLASAKAIPLDPANPADGIAARRVSLRRQATALGLSPDAVDSLPDDALTNAGLNTYIGRVYSQGGMAGVEKFGTMLSADAKQALTEQQFGETKRHNVADETNAKGQLGVAQGSLAERTRNDQVSNGIAAGHLAVARAKEAREATQSGSGKPPTEDQAKAVFSSQRMAGASQVLNPLEQSGAFNATMAGAGSVLMQSKSRQYQAAKGEWADALIRETTGAAATRAEVAAVDQSYFPQPGDSAAVIQQKAARRARTEADIASRGSGVRQGAAGFQVVGVR